MAPRLLNCYCVGDIIRKLSCERQETLAANDGVAEAPRDYPLAWAA
jgi:hypothetical protein